MFVRRIHVQGQSFQKAFRPQPQERSVRPHRFRAEPEGLAPERGGQGRIVPLETRGLPPQPLREDDPILGVAQGALKRFELDHARLGGGVDFGQDFYRVTQPPNPDAKFMEPPGLVTAVEGLNEVDGAAAVLPGFRARSSNHRLDRRLGKVQQVDEKAIQILRPAPQAAGQGGSPIAFGKADHPSLDLQFVRVGHATFGQKGPAHVSVAYVGERADRRAQDASRPADGGTVRPSCESRQGGPERPRGHPEIVHTLAVTAEG